MKTLVVLTSIGLLGMFSEIFRVRKILLPLVVLGLIAAIGAAVFDWNTNAMYHNNMMLVDNYSLAFSITMIATTLLWFSMSSGFFSSENSKSDHFSLIVFALTGAVLMTSFNNLLMLFLGIEILSISMYILAGSNKTNLSSNEAALKYFLMGSFATGFLLFGVALVYGATGSFHLDQIATAVSLQAGSWMLYAGVLMILVAMAFKVSAVPFHFWAPDVYQGSPTVVTSFMSTVVKTAALAAFFRLFIHTFSPVSQMWHTTLYVIAAATILVGNITAVYQTNVKRMLAYSSISHAGYMLIAILAMHGSAGNSLLFYAIAYSASSLASFAVLLIISSSTGNESIESFYGLARKNPFLAVMVVISVLSLAGIPPTAGFFAKYYIFVSAMQNGLTPLVIIAITGSLIGVFYYFRLIIALFRDGDAVQIQLKPAFNVVLITAAVIALVLGLMPGLVVELL